MTQRELNKLGKTLRQNSQTAIHCTMEFGEAKGHAASNHFRGVTKMVELNNNRSVVA